MTGTLVGTGCIGFYGDFADINSCGDVDILFARKEGNKMQRNVLNHGHRIL